MTATADNAPTGITPAAAGDEWSQWLLHGRFGDDPGLARDMQGDLHDLADRVLQMAAPRGGETLLDVGTGDGLVALRAIAQAGPGLQAWLGDISQTLLDHARARAQAQGVQAQCRFFCLSADRLEGIADASVDIVTTRSVLAYVQDKGRALAEFFRVLRPGGRIALAEPLMRDDALEAVALRELHREGQAGPEHDILRLVSRWKSAQYPDTFEKLQTHPMTSFGARDLFGLAVQAGFERVHAEHHLDQRVVPAMGWETFCARVPFPGAPSLAQVLQRDFSPAEQAQLQAHLRPRVEGGASISTDQMVYVSARKPATYR